MFDTKLNYESRFFISGQQLSGIDSINLSYNQQANIIKPLGYSKGITVVNGESQNTISISRNLIYADPLLNYTGNINMSGSIHYENSSYGFKSGYLTEYLVNCAIGAIPKVTTNFNIFDHLVSGSSASGSVSHPNIYIPNQGSMSITCDNVSSNRVVGFDYSIKNNNRPIYTIGSSLPAKIEFLPPLDYSATVQIEIDDAFMKNSSAFLSGREDKIVSLSIRGRDGTIIQSLTIPKASLISEQLSASADGVLKLTLNYNGHS
jgi:hypothetical protein